MGQHKRKEVGLRVRRIHGHVQAITEMLEEGRPYPEIVHQVSAVKAALDGVIRVIVDDLVEDCVAKKERKEQFEDSLLQLQEVVGKLR